MPNCEDCIFYEKLCQHALEEHELKLCKDFKNKADFVEVKHGEWIEMAKDSVGRAFMCSVCGAAEVTETFDKSPLDNDCNYCYRCGAKMDGKRSAEE